MSPTSVRRSSAMVPLFRMPRRLPGPRANRRLLRRKRVLLPFGKWGGGLPRRSPGSGPPEPSASLQHPQGKRRTPPRDVSLPTLFRDMSLGVSVLLTS